MSTLKVTAFPWVPPFAQGLVRDLRVRWACEEAGLPYEQVLLQGDDQKSASYRAKQPFGQVPVLEDGDFSLFESAAIVFYIAEKSGKLMPAGLQDRARTVSGMFAALNSVEPHITQLNVIDLFNPDKEWAKLRRPEQEQVVRGRLASLSTWFGDRQYWVGDSFTIADLLLVTVLRNLRHTKILADYPNLQAYRDRGESRPAFQRALAAQMANFG
jgi:glutathione S-transferase